MMPRGASSARLTILLISANILVAALLLVAGPPSGDLAISSGGLVPMRLSMGLAGSAPLLPVVASLFTNMFLHAGLLHLGLNMVLLLAMGRLLEPIYGSGRFLLLYLAGGLAAGLAEFVADPASLVPVVGASGAISALIAAQALIINQARAVQDGKPAPSRLKLAVQLGLAWAVVQVLAGVVLAGQGINLAVMGHVGGFLAGLALAFALLPGSIHRDAGA
jgi:membrane associated rhomboid family serine protease